MFHFVLFLLALLTPSFLVVVAVAAQHQHAELLTYTHTYAQYTFFLKIPHSFTIHFLLCCCFCKFRYNYAKRICTFLPWCLSGWECSNFIFVFCKAVCFLLSAFSLFLFNYFLLIFVFVFFNFCAFFMFAALPGLHYA